jgi:sugar O-acyltransferase (sialic acid O-acetyltransferase NeuD family)
MNIKNLILIGGGGHCRSCIDVIEQLGTYEIMGILDLPEKVNSDIMGYRVIGTDDDIEKLSGPDTGFLITLGQIRSPIPRKKLYHRLMENSLAVPVIISPSACVSPHAEIGGGTIVMHQALVNAGAKIGSNCILNSQALIEHEAVIGSHCHVSTGVKVNGQAVIQDECFVGSGSVIYNNIVVAAGTIIAAGSVVRKSITEPGLYQGNPAKKVSRL